MDSRPFADLASARSFIVALIQFVDERHRVNSAGLGFQKDVNLGSKCIPIGGENYDRDLKQGLGITLEEAQRIKKSYGKAWLDEENDELDDFIDVKFYGRREYDKAKRRRLYEIMQPRTEELLEEIITALNESGQFARVAGSVVIVGGASQLRQLRRYLQRNLQRRGSTRYGHGVRSP